jgi:hypothetical protein
MHSIGRDLPAGYDVRPAIARDGSRVEKDMRPVDRAELESLEGRPAAEILSGAIAGGMRVLTIRSEPVVVYGIAACAGLPGHAMPWAATVATLDHDDLMNIMWLSRHQLEAWQRRWPTLQALCDTRNVFHRDWLTWLGFLPSGRPAACGVTGQAFDLFVRR